MSGVKRSYDLCRKKMYFVIPLLWGTSAPTLPRQWIAENRGVAPPRTPRKCHDGGSPLELPPHSVITRPMDDSSGAERERAQARIRLSRDDRDQGCRRRPCGRAMVRNGKTTRRDDCRDLRRPIDGRVEVHADAADDIRAVVLL